VAIVIRQYAHAAQIEPHPKIVAGDHLRRLIHSSANELGLVIEMVTAAIEEALLHQETQLDVDAFRRAFRRKTGCPDVLNPIVAEDWRAIDARKLFDGGISISPSVLDLGRAGR
jgi:hypothetical protein